MIVDKIRFCVWMCVCEEGGLVESGWLISGGGGWITGGRLWFRVGESVGVGVESVGGEGAG